MLVRAFAGTGKTTTLLEVRQASTGHKFAYLTFNRQVMLEAERKFPANTKALNFHGLAFKARGFAYNRKMLREVFGRDTRATRWVSPPTTNARLAIRTLGRSSESADEHITQDHAPPGRAGEEGVLQRLGEGSNEEERSRDAEGRPGGVGDGFMGIDAAAARSERRQGHVASR